jgi:hypothetical protein
MNYLVGALERLAEEPPFRLVTRAIIKRTPTNIRTKARWDAVARPHYLAGVLAGADQAKREGASEISVMEFGVAGGNGLVVLQEYAAAVERETGVRIAVYGFDAGGGLPALCGDYRDHPDQWRPSDYRMDEHALRQRLSDRTTLIIGDIKATLPDFVAQRKAPPVGFVSVDVDLYSSTVDTLKLFTLPGKRMLRRVPMYFDDTDFVFNHRFAGEFLAIEEFNRAQDRVKIDIWRGIWKNRPFSESPWLRNMYMAHDLEAISSVSLDRSPAPLGLDKNDPG